ncbi:MAG: ABC transporter ATP-binding protein, partial [Deltaproteobacteria bacterium]|nr:ABC transporter ATP-binding protein [Deltaproteobacteria bacterium]
ELKNLSKHYRSLRAVHELNLTVAEGEIFGFIGPNGAGKTTTIRMMGGVILPTQGEIYIDGISMAADPVEAKKRIGFIPDRPFLYEKLTGMEFLKFTADLFHVERDLFGKKSKEILKMFSLLDRADELIESYSHGMKQRLIIGAAILHEPRVIVVDEPMVGLDPAGIKLVKDLFRRLASGGTTLFLSTHSLDVAEDLCHRMGIIHRGSLIATGNLSELRQLARVQESDLEAVFLKLTEEEVPL